MPCEICSWVEIVYTTCQLSLNLETGAQKVPLKPVALAFPECNISRGVMLWGPLSPITVSKRYSRPMFPLTGAPQPPPISVPTYAFHAGRSWHGMRSARNVHVNSS